MKKILYTIILTFLLVSCSGKVEDNSKNIKLFINNGFGSMYNQSTFEPFINELKENTGLSIEIEKSADYYKKLPILFAINDYPDILELEGPYYYTYAGNNVLWDMTEAWENSNIKKSGTIDERFIELSKVDGKLYGFPVNRGNGAITYIRKDWLDNLGLMIPKTYDEFYEVLRAFREDDPDGNGKKDTFGLTAAGVMSVEPPYDIFLREFYQDASPTFYYKDGVYVDGMNDPEMIDALGRLQDAYTNMYIDPELSTNNMETALEKFYNGKAGIISYWAGNGNVLLDNHIKLNNKDGEVIPIALEDVTYVEKTPFMMTISATCQNPQEVFEKFIDYSYDGGDGQILFTRGVENVNYKNENGVIVQLPNPENSNILFEKSLYAPEQLISSFDDIIGFDQRVVNSLKIFRENSELAKVPITEEKIIEQMYYLNDVRALVITETMFGRMTPEEAIEKYNANGEEMINAILEELNG